MLLVRSTAVRMKRFSGNIYVLTKLLPLSVVHLWRGHQQHLPDLENIGCSLPHAFQRSLTGMQSKSGLACYSSFAGCLNAYVPPLVNT